MTQSNTDALIERLLELTMREVSDGVYTRETPVPINRDGPEAADLITSQQSRIEALEEALDPFARAAAIQPSGSAGWPDDKPNLDFLPGFWPTWGDFRRAYAVLKGKTQP